MKQYIAGHPIDMLTDQELKQSLGHALDPVIRAMRGEKLMRMPTARVVATATTQALSATPPGAPIGPESGYMWRIARLIVTSSSLTDPAKYVLYEGSDVTDFAPIRVMDAMTAPVAAVTQPTPPAITVGASPFTFVNVQPYTVLVTVTGGTVTSITVNGQTTGAVSGTFALTPDSFMVVTYTAAPAMTEVNAIANTAAIPAGLNVNQGYNPGSKGLWLFNDEQIYAQIFNATIGATYFLKGVIAQVPQEMQGKLI